MLTGAPASAKLHEMLSQQPELARLPGCIAAYLSVPRRRIAEDQLHTVVFSNHVRHSLLAKLPPG